MVSDGSSSWFDALDHWLDGLLKIGESLTVITIAIAVLSTITYELIWNFLCDPAVRQSRITGTLRTLNEDWKAGLILIVPLFYRTIKSFLERVEEFAGAKAPRAPKATTKETPNPPEVPPEAPSQEPMEVPKRES